MILLVALVALCFGMFLGLVIGGLCASSGRADEMDRLADDAYSDGYEQAVEDQQHGIARLPVHRRS